MKSFLREYVMRAVERAADEIVTKNEPCAPPKKLPHLHPREVEVSDEWSSPLQEKG